MRSVLALAGLVALAAASKTITQTTTVEVTVVCFPVHFSPRILTSNYFLQTSCAPEYTACEWDDSTEPASSTYWGDVPAEPTATNSWEEVPVEQTTASTWADVPVPTKPVVADYTKPAAPVADYTGGAAQLTGAGIAGVVAMAAMLL